MEANVKTKIVIDQQVWDEAMRACLLPFKSHCTKCVVAQALRKAGFPCAIVALNTWQEWEGGPVHELPELASWLIRQFDSFHQARFNGGGKLEMPTLPVEFEVDAVPPIPYP